MREIKFRVWDTATGDFLNNYTIYQYGNIASNGEWLPSKEIVVQQYTGLKDKNGKEIYEGDVVNHLFHKEQFQVVWNERKASFIALYLHGSGRYSGGVKDSLFEIDNPHYEIIGNVYEHPELLNEK